jgi:hypothetical protein
MERIKYILFLLIILTLMSCENPFAPARYSGPESSTILSNQKTIDGVFQNFRYAYTFKDTLVYGKLLSSNFTFVYRNYDLGADYSWGRAQDMLSTNNLFQAAQNLDLIWNEIVLSNGDSLVYAVSRSFNLSIVFNPSDVVRIQGRAYFELRRETVDDVWQIYKWRDESNY